MTKDSLDKCKRMKKDNRASALLAIAGTVLAVCGCLCAALNGDVMPAVCFLALAALGSGLAAKGYYEYGTARMSLEDYRD